MQMKKRISQRKHQVSQRLFLLSTVCVVCLAFFYTASASNNPSVASEQQAPTVAAAQPGQTAPRPANFSPSYLPPSSPLPPPVAAATSVKRDRKVAAKDEGEELRIPHDHFPLRPSEDRLLPPPPYVHYCPLTKDLKKQGLRWEIGDTWTSYSESFSTHITAFLGAQWTGIKIGKVICIYQGDGKFDFPIALEPKRNKVIMEPAGQYWSALVQNYKFCKSSNIYDCPFSAKPAEKTVNIYEAIRYKEPQISGHAHAVDY